MRTGISALAACSLLVLAAGCGSSSSSGTSTAKTTSTATTPTGVSAGAGLKAYSRPKYASPPASAPTQSGTVQIAYRNITIAPDTLRVKVGTTIRWTNYDSIEHNVTTKGGPQTFASHNFGEGGTYQITLTKPGVIHYVCTIHPTTMNGTIEVVR
jgi:plastocyanin